MVKAEVVYISVSKLVGQAIVAILSCVQIHVKLKSSATSGAKYRNMSSNINVHYLIYSKLCRYNLKPCTFSLLVQFMQA